MNLGNNIQRWGWGKHST